MTAASAVYPVEFEKIWLDHRGGTKSYQIQRITAANGKSLVIWRWGKTGKEGQVQVFSHENAADALKAYNSKVKDRESGGYGERKEGRTQGQANDLSELRKAIGIGAFMKLGPDNIHHIDPDADTKGVREAEPEPEWIPDPKNPGKFINVNERKPKTIPPPPDPTQEERVASDPMWGLF